MRRGWPVVCAALIAMATAPAPAAAEPAPAPARVERDEPRRHAVYVEALGKGGLWGLGYEARLSDRLGAGVVGSFTVLDDQRITMLSPYLAVRLLGRGRHRWFLHAGPQLTHVATPSPVPEWSGTSSSGVSGELSSGWEYRGHVLVRLFGMVAAGEKGVAPWVGASLGWTL